MIYHAHWRWCSSRARLRKLYSPILVFSFSNEQFTTPSILRICHRRYIIMGGDLTPTELLTLDANALQQRLEAGSLSSVELVTCCLTQIETYDQQRAQLRAIIATAPRERLLSRALQLDVERSSGHVRSHLHGIPVLVKVRNISEILESSSELVRITSQLVQSLDSIQLSEVSL